MMARGLGQGLSPKPDFSRIRICFGDLNGSLWALNDEFNPMALFGRSQMTTLIKGVPFFHTRDL